MAKISDDDVKTLIQAYWGDIAQSTGDVSDQRLLGIKYYNRDYFGGEVAGWSDFVSSDVFDAVEWTLAECMDIFFGTSPIGTFVADNMDDVEAAEQETKMVKNIIEEKNNGFLLFYTWLKDALIQKNGIVKCYWDEVVHEEKETYRDKSFGAFASLMQDKDVEVTAVTVRLGDQELSIEDVQGMPPEMLLQATFDIDCVRKSDVSQVRIENVQPENFFVDKTHASLDLSKAMFVAERVFVRRSDLYAMKYDIEKVDSIPKTTILFNSQEERARDGDKINYFINIGSGDSGTLTDRLEILEVYFRADVNKTKEGDLRLYRAIVGGTFGFNQAGNGVNVVLECEEVDSIPYCALSPNIIPHRFWGISKFDEVGDIQRYKSSLMRGVLNNMIQHNAPQTFVEATVGLDLDSVADASPGEYHLVNNVAGILSHNVEYVADKNIPILTLLDEVAERRTGISKVTQGLDPQALSESTQFVGASIMNASQKKLKNILRIFAETGIKSLYLRVHELLRKYAQDAMILRDEGKYIEIDPREWRKRKSFDITIGSGRSDKDAKIAALQGVLGLQRDIAASGGIDNNPLLTPMNLYKTMSELVTLSGLGDVENYFSNPENFQPAPPPPAPMDKAMDIEEARVTADASYKAESLHLEKYKADIEAQISKEKIELERDRIKLKIMELNNSVNENNTAEQENENENETEMEDEDKDLERRNKELELESKQLENDLKRAKIESLSKDQNKEIQNSILEANQSLIMASQMLEKLSGESKEKPENDAVSQNIAAISEAIAKIGDAINAFSEASIKNTKEALSMVSKPKRIVRENGKISRIETEE